MQTRLSNLVARAVPLIAAAASFHAIPAHAADAFRLSVQPGSTLSTTQSLFTPSSGFLIGNYDATTNPTGTRTIPGLFGGSGNNQIPVDVDVSVGGTNNSTPAGALTIAANIGAGTFALASLDLDLLNGTTIDLPIEATFLYSTFRTVSPSFIYPGGSPIALTLGNAQVTLLTATLGAGTSGGTLTSNGDGTYQLAGVATLDLSFEAEVLGQPFAQGPTPVFAPIGGTYTPSPDGLSATLTLNIDIQNSQTIPGPIPGPEAVPFALPTFDPSAPANVLLTLTFERVDITVNADIDAQLAGPLVCKADFNLDGEADILDFLDFFDAFSQCDGQPAPCTSTLNDADVNNDGSIDILDFLDFLNAFSAGCE